MRVYPPVVNVSREAVRDTEIGGRRIPRGTTLLMSQWLLHRDPRYFERPGEFEPERWADGLAARLPRFAYFPFGGGPRTCLGRQLVKMELTLIVAAMTQRIRIELIPGRAVEQVASETLRPANGIWIAVRRR
jgi:cytochrome P450